MVPTLKKAYITCMLILVALCGCVEPSIESNKDSTFLSRAQKAPPLSPSQVMPMTSKSRLDSLFNQDPTQVIYYRTARCLAELELLADVYALVNLSQTDVWQSSAVTRKKNGKVKDVYFHVTDNGNIIRNH